MKQKLKRFMASFMAMLTVFTTLLSNGTTAFAASPQANMAFWNASVCNSGEVSELKPGYNHGKILYSVLDGNAAYCMNFGLRADGGQLMNSYDNPSTSMSASQEKLLRRRVGGRDLRNTDKGGVRKQWIKKLHYLQNQKNLLPGQTSLISY